ncbi:MAG: TMEM165/GDT1 family protein [Oscillospiraceae bacterium]|nr:TMEM165/GDT1 family protein [Oscillospiraceae bacterium]
MVLFFQIMLTMFIAEMGDKTQLLMIAMTSRYKLRDIIIGSVASILALNALAVALGALISEIIPTWLIKLIAGAAFFYFSWSTLRGGDDEEKERSGVGAAHPILSVFGTFFLAELGDKTQLTAITFAASGGAQNAVTVWLACSIGLFAADLIGMLLGYLLKKNTSGNFLNTVAFIIFAVFGFTTVAEGLGLLLGGGALRWAIAVIVAAVFALLCLLTWRGKTRER